MDQTAGSTESRRQPTSEELQEIIALYEDGHYLRAYRRSEKISPLATWTATPARIMAGRMAGNLGGGKLSRVLLHLAWRRDKTDPTACLFRARYLLGARGAWTALRFMKERGTLADADRDTRTNWLCLHVTIHSQVRDFDTAAKWLAQAEATGGDPAWVQMERAGLHSAEDREEDAIRAARAALSIRPWFRPAVQWLAHFLVQKEQDDEALALLQEASERIESYAVLSQLANLQLETGRYADARRNLEGCVRLAPFMDKITKQWLASRRCEAAYFCDDLEDSRHWASESTGRFFEVQAERLKDPPADLKRVCLPVGFVKQHHWTCAPATLAAICRYWSMAGAHLEVAADISFAGTPNHSERQWAIDNGWFTKEFTVTEESARAVLDRGVPFTLTTPEVSSSHLQAVIGYDDIRGSIIIRDPGERHQIEMLAEGLDRYRSSGPRGLALAPMAEKHRLEDLTLPDAELYDEVFRLERALAAHDRTRAEAICGDLAAKAAGHRLAMMGQRILASYDADTVRLLSSVENLMTLFPDDLRLQFSKAASLRELARRSEYLELLEKLSTQPKTDTACWEQYSQELSVDARRHAEAEYWLKRTMRFNRSSARAFNGLAGVYWGQRRFEEAFELYRFAACLEDTNEYFASTYFESAKFLGRVEEGLDFLRRRFRRFGKKSALPARSLAWACFLLERTGEGYAVLDEAMKLRPDDGDLMLAVVDQSVQHGKFAEARALAVKSRRKSNPSGWLRSVAKLESAQGNLIKARKLWARVLAIQPLAEDAHRAYAHLLAGTVGRNAALQHLHAANDRFPHNLRLIHLLMDWKREDGPRAVEQVVRRMLDLHPADAWAWRQLALVLAEQNRLDEAFAALAVAEPLEPTGIGYQTVRASLLKQTGRFAEAKESFRAALRISADSTYAMNELIGISETPAERREELKFIEAEQVRQVIGGNGLLTFRNLASGTLDAEELLAVLRQALEARPDLWQARAVVVRQLRQMERLDEAKETVKAALEKFPLTPELWVDLADVLQSRREEVAAVDALQTAHTIHLDWSEPLRQLVELHRRRGEIDEAQSLVERAVARAPLNPENHFILARLLWNIDQLPQGFDRMRRAVMLDPGYQNAWELLCSWATHLGCYQAVVDLARDLTVNRGGEIRSWMRLAEALRAIPGKDLRDEPERQEEILAALARVLQLRPWLLEAHDLKAQVLAESDRWVEAQAACQAPIWQGRVPVPLRGRLAWVTHLRGDPEAAIAMMNRAVEEDREYFWGWKHLAHWNELLERHADSLRAAEMLTTLDPYNPSHYARRGRAKRTLGDRAGAMADFRRAIDLSPDFVYPALQLFDLHVEDGNTIEARRLLDSVDPTELQSDYSQRSLQLSLAERDTKGAVASLEDLCGSNDEALLKKGIAAFEKAELAAEAEDVLHRYLGGGFVVCKLWVAAATKRSSIEAVRERINELVPRHLAKTNVLIAYAEALSRAEKSAILYDLVREHETLFRAKTAPWGRIGSCFSRVLDDERTASWLADWRERDKVEPWMMMNLTLALRGLQRDAESAEISRYVLEEVDTDYTTPFHEVWMVFDAALAGDTELPRAYFEAHEASELDPNHKWIAALARSVFECRAAQDKEKALAEAESRIAKTAAEIKPIDRDQVFDIAYRKCIRAMAAACGLTGSEWERSRHESPVMPKRKASGDD